MYLILVCDFVVFIDLCLHS